MTSWWLGWAEDCSPVQVRLAEVSGIVVAGLAGFGKTMLVAHLLGPLAPSDAVQFVLVDGKGGPDYDRLIPRAWLAVKQLGLEGLRFHDLRHTAATLAAAAGATTRELMERRGTPRQRWPCATTTSWPTGKAPLPPPWTAWLAMPKRKTGVGRGHDGPRRGNGKRAAS